MKRFFFCNLLILSVLAPVFSQSVKAYERDGDRAFEKKDFNQAVQRYAYVLKKDPKNLDVLYKYAECARLFMAYPIAEKSYLTISKSKRASQFPLLDFWLGAVKKSQGQYAAARDYFKKYAASSDDDVFKKRAEAEILACDFAEKALAEAQNAAQKIEIASLGRSVNSAFSELGPAFRGDTLYFSSYRFDKQKSRAEPKPKLTKTLFSVSGGRGKSLGRGFPADDSTHVAHTAFSRKGHRAYLNFCKNTGPSDIRCELFFIEKDKKNKWKKPVRLGGDANLTGTTSTQPSLFWNEKTRRETLLFVSDRAGGKGKLDIWAIEIDSATGQPSGKALNLEAVNTAENDITPNFHEPSGRLFFSSEGWTGMGGYDVFASKKDEKGQFSAPEHQGSPINTSYNDLYFLMKKDGRTGVLASNRPGSMYLDEANKACCNDLFSFKIPEPPKPKEPEKTPTDSSKIVEKVPPVPVEPTAPTRPADPDAPKKLEDFAGLPLYFDNDEPDKRTRKTTTKKTYEESFWAYFEQKELYRAEFSKGLSDEKRFQAEDEIELFFENEVKRGHDRLFSMSDFLLTRLEQGETVEILIKGFTSPRAESDYNVALGKRRISSLRNHFSAFGEGVFQPFLQSGKLRITETSFGETTARKDISDKIDDRRGSVYSPAAARERRVEIVGIKSE